MNAPDTVHLVELKVGDCFQFAQHRSRRMTDEHVPQWKVVHAGTEFYEVMLDNISPINSGPAARSTRLAGTTLVRRVAGVRNPDFEVPETAGAKVERTNKIIRSYFPANPHEEEK